MDGSLESNAGDRDSNFSDTVSSSVSDMQANQHTIQHQVRQGANGYYYDIGRPINETLFLSPDNLVSSGTFATEDDGQYTSRNLLITSNIQGQRTASSFSQPLDSLQLLRSTSASPLICNSPQLTPQNSSTFSQFSSPSVGSRAGDIPTPNSTLPAGCPPELQQSSNRKCEVCKEHASGNHYGCWTCEGCKAFFKRSVQANSQYTCVSGNDCDVEGAGRKNCPACRLRKCFIVGMTSESIKRDRRFTSSSTQDAASIFRQENPVAASLLHRLIEIEIEPISADFSLPEAGDELLSANAYLIKLFARLADRLLSFYVEWAKSIPGYSSLTLSTQRSLLSRCFFVEALLDMMYRSIELEDGNIQISADIAMTQNALMSLSNGNRYEVHDEIQEAAKLFKNLRVSYEEFLALKCVVLLSSEDLIDVASDLTYVKTLQDRAIDCLIYAVHETLYRLDINTPEEVMQRRTSKLLILISRLNRLAFQILTHIIRVKDSIPMFELVGSLLSQNMPN
ncbi:steroid hormone receptor ERR2-like [Convolutriloba macropyga]|uniref:steroid hormone receptor ERR2-like n=1 Tax=Convolutriloba macropyga TaxID=536237 RepID=UPI003F5288E3